MMKMKVHILVSNVGETTIAYNQRLQDFIESVQSEDGMVMCMPAVTPTGLFSHTIHYAKNDMKPKVWDTERRALDSIMELINETIPGEDHKEFNYFRNRIREIIVEALR